MIPSDAAWAAGTFLLLGVSTMYGRLERARQLATLAARAGLNAHRPRFYARPVVTGEISGVALEASLAKNAGEFALEVVVRGLEQSIDLHARNEKDPPRRATGDSRFDRSFIARGEPANVLALLDSDARDALRALAGARADLDVTRGVLRAHLREPRRNDWADSMGARLDEALPLLVRVARALTPDPRERPGEKLLERLRTDPVGTVRLAALEALLASSTGAARAEALRIASTDSDPALRFFAAREAGRDGIPVLLTVAKSRSVPAALQSQALIALEPLIGREELADLALAALRAPRARVRATGASLAGRLGVRAAVPLLRTAVERADLPERRAIAEALGRIGVPETEAPLLELLATPDGTVQRATVEWLARVGGAASVAPLRELASAASGDLAREAKAAVARIQSRLDGAELGQLTLADSEAGRVSLPLDAGAVSIAASGKPAKRPLE
ncbi:MAG TPA: HEAT repeat domain-containing protein [bacterium]|nr:HEAT repeat domain-containing protein [bacterium]